jgi:uncharacterized protein
MKNKLIVSNSSPLMNLAIIGQLSLLHDLFGRITIPNEVWQELVIDGEGKPGTDEIIKATSWIEISAVDNIALFRLLKKDLDTGEAAAISLAIEKNADLILLDEMDARSVAEIYNLPKAGVLGVLMRAKKQGLIKEIKPFLNSLKNEANFWIKQQLYDRILIEMGEYSRPAKRMRCKRL